MIDLTTHTHTKKKIPLECLLESYYKWIWWHSTWFKCLSLASLPGPVLPCVARCPTLSWAHAINTRNCRDVWQNLNASTQCPAQCVWHFSLSRRLCSSRTQKGQDFLRQNGKQFLRASFSLADMCQVTLRKITRIEGDDGGHFQVLQNPNSRNAFSDVFIWYFFTAW